jgi:hypothetical protein
MARIAYAARTLLEQAGGQPIGDPDGLGVTRSVAVPLGDLDPASVDADDRVRAAVAVGDVLIVTFVTGRKADLTHPFGG